MTAESTVGAPTCSLMKLSMNELRAQKFHFNSLESSRIETLLFPQIYYPEGDVYAPDENICCNAIFLYVSRPLSRTNFEPKSFISNSLKTAE
jgi:hypothetical protein